MSLKKSEILYYTILFIILIGIYGSANLVRHEFTQGEVCPKILGIPACFIILSCFLLATIGHLLSNWSIAFYLGVLTALSIALVGTIGEWAGYDMCPKTEDGIPMCFISLAIFGSLLILKLLLQKLNQQ